MSFHPVNLPERDHSSVRQEAPPLNHRSSEGRAIKWIKEQNETIAIIMTIVGGLLLSLAICSSPIGLSATVAIILISIGGGLAFGGLTFLWAKSKSEPLVEGAEAVIEVEDEEGLYCTPADKLQLKQSAERREREAFIEAREALKRRAANPRYSKSRLSNNQKALAKLQRCLEKHDTEPRYVPGEETLLEEARIFDILERNLV